MQKDVIFSEQRDCLTAHIQRDLDHHSAKSIREQIDRRLFETRPSVLVIDFTKVEFMDSSGLGLILGRVEKASALGAEVLVSGASPTLMKLIRLSGIERVRHLSVVK
ncbi:MAG: anti-sigma factor antagonist [Clostridia bacterium]|nr:anti-sigma factor antagonist [Clostridia bacterium]